MMRFKFRSKRSVFQNQQIFFKNVKILENFQRSKNTWEFTVHELKSLHIDTLVERVFYVEIICHGIHPIYYAFVST